MTRKGEEGKRKGGLGICFDFFWFFLGGRRGGEVPEEDLVAKFHLFNEGFLGMAWMGIGFGSIL